MPGYKRKRERKNVRAHQITIEHTEAKRMICHIKLKIKHSCPSTAALICIKPIQGNKYNVSLRLSCRCVCVCVYEERTHKNISNTNASHRHSVWPEHGKWCVPVTISKHLFVNSTLNALSLTIVGKGECEQILFEDFILRCIVQVLSLPKQKYSVHVCMYWK